MLDSVEFYQVFLGALRHRRRPGPVNPLLPGRDLGAIVASSPGPGPRRLAGTRVGKSPPSARRAAEVDDDRRRRLAGVGRAAGG